MMWPPPRRKRRLSIAIPASIVSEVPHLRERTSRLGFIGRALAIFRVDEVVIYPDISWEEQSEDAAFVAKILSYMEVPPFFRKSLFEIDEDLKYVGVLPPLRTPSHAVGKSPKEGEIRPGLVVGKKGKFSLVDVGLKQPIKVSGYHRGRIVVKMEKRKGEWRGVVLKPSSVPIYMGYEVKVSHSTLGSLVRKYDLKIATSREGKLAFKAANSIKKAWAKSKNVLVAFGSPREGLDEILRRENLSVRKVFDFVVNVIPNQGVVTVRTEEAIYATLTFLNLLVRE